MSEFFNATVQTGNVLDVLDKIANMGGDLEPSMRSIANFMENQVRLGFQQGRSPYGDSWAPIKRQGQTLVDTRTLLGSISSQYGNDFAEVGTNVKYAAIHQFGGQAGKNKAVTIQARPYFPIQGDEFVLPAYWEESILGILEKQLESLFNG